MSLVALVLLGSHNLISRRVIQGASDAFGWSVSLSGDGNSLAVGARYEASNAEGVSRGTQAQGSDDGTAQQFRCGISLLTP